MNAILTQHDDEANELAMAVDMSGLERQVDAICALVDRQRARIETLKSVNHDLLVALRAFVALYDGTHDLLGVSVRAKLSAAKLAITKAEESHV